MHIFNIEVDEPKGSPRPRFASRGRFTKAYMPQSYTDYKNHIKDQLPNLMLDSELEVEINFYFVAPKSWSNKKRVAAIGQYKKTKPDIDNLLKSVMDACNDHVWVDDNRVCKIISVKKYSENAGIEIKIKEV